MSDLIFLLLNGGGVTISIWLIIYAREKVRNLVGEQEQLKRIRAEQQRVVDELMRTAKD